MAASPQRPDPRDRGPYSERGPVVDTERRVEKEVGTGRPFAWWWIWIPLVIAAFWYAGWGWGPYGGWWWGRSGASATRSAQNARPTPPVTANQAGANGAAPGGATNTQAGPAETAAQAGQITGPGAAVLDAKDKKTYIGQPFDIRNIPVQKRVSNSAVWIGSSNTNNSPPMLLVLAGAANSRTTSGLGIGDRVNVTGTVEKAPAAAKARHNWGLSGSDANNLEREGAFIQASQVQPVQP